MPIPLVDAFLRVLDDFPTQWIARIIRPGRDRGHAIPPEMARDADQLWRMEKVLSRVRTGDHRTIFLPVVESYTQETQEMRLAYRVMLRDPYVKAALLNKVLAVAALDAQVQPASDRGIDKDAADFVKHSLHESRGGTTGVAQAILLPGLIEGYSVSEKVWQLETRGRWAGKYRLRCLKSKDPQWLQLMGDSFRNINSIRDMRTSEEWNPSWFVVWQHLPIYENPFGMSDLRAAYRAYWVRDAAWKLRSIALERFSLPALKGVYRSPDQKDALEADLPLLRSQSWITVPEGVAIEALELATRGPSDFEAAIKDLNEEIVVGITGAVLQMLQGQVTDGRGSSETHRSTAELLQWMLAAELGHVINDQIVPDLVDVNFDGAGYPKVTFGGVNDSSMTASVQIDQFLWQAGVPLSKEELYERYGRQRPVDDEDTLLMPQMAPPPPGGDPNGPNQPPPEMMDEDGAPAGAGPDPKDQAAQSKAVAQLQADYHAGKVGRDAAIANAVLTLGATRREAEALFPPLALPAPGAESQPGQAPQAAQSPPPDASPQPGGSAQPGPDLDREPASPEAFADDDDGAPGAAPPAWLLDLPDVRQRADYDCGPAAVACVERFLSGRRRPLATLAREMGTSRRDGTAPPALVAYLQRAGLQVAEGKLDADDLDHYTRLGWPVICPAQRGESPASFAGGHYVVVRGVGEDGAVFVQDPDGGPGAWPGRDFARRWHDRDGAGRVYVRYGVAVGPPLAGGGGDGGGGPGKMADADAAGAAPTPAPHKFSTTQFDAPSDIAALQRQAAALIADADLSDDGREENAHVTVKYGLHTDDAEAVRRAVAGFGPVTVEFGPVSLFAASSGDEQRGGHFFDVVKVEVLGDDIRRLNRLIADRLPHTDTHPVYSPHMTLGYVRPGDGAKYVGPCALTGKRATFGSLTFSDRHGNRTAVSLSAPPDAAMAFDSVSAMTGGVKAFPPTA